MSYMALLHGICRTISHTGRTFTSQVGQTVAWLTAVLAVVTAVIVVLRLLFQFGSVGMQESLTYLHALIIMLASAYTLASDGHVRVDIFYRRYSPLQKAWVNALGTIVFLLPFALFTLFISWRYVANSWHIQETSADAGGIPVVYLLKSLLLVNSVLLIIQALADLAAQLSTLTYSDNDA